MRVLITGRPGSGKTTLVKRVSMAVGLRGFVTEEVREEGKRVGFDIVRIPEGERRVLARVGEGYPRVGKYRVFLEGLENALAWLPEERVVIDEIGPMELRHPKFEETVRKILSSAEDVLFTVHYRLVKRWKRYADVVVEVTPERREELYVYVKNLFEK